jgi:hypothetical protein
MFIKWEIHHQNTFVKLDMLKINWNDINYIDDIKHINETYGDLCVPQNRHIVNKPTISDGWLTVTSDKTTRVNKQILKRMGFIERVYKKPS